MATVNPAPVLSAVTAAMQMSVEPITIVADVYDADLDRCGYRFGADHYTFGGATNAAYMPAQLRAYITPEEYESAIAMSNKL